MNANILSIDHVQIAAPKGAEKAAREFYGDILGLDELIVPPVLRDRACCWFQCGDLEVHIGIQKNFQPAKKAHVAFLTQNVEELKKIFQLRGIVVTEAHARPEIHRFFTEDPWGNRLEFLEKRI